MDQSHKYKAKTTKNIRANLHDHGCYNGFIDMIQKAEATKEKIS